MKCLSGCCAICGGDTLNLASRPHLQRQYRRRAQDILELRASDQNAAPQIGKVTTQAGSTSRPGSAQNAALNVSGLSVGGCVAGVMPNLTLPPNSLFKTHSEPGSKYLVETDRAIGWTSESDCTGLPSDTEPKSVPLLALKV